MNEAMRRARLTTSPGRLRLVIDSDAKNEIDDQYAIAWALRSTERFQVEAVYAAPFSHNYFRRNVGVPEGGIWEDPALGMRQSYDEILRLYGLLNLDAAGHVFHGAERYLPLDRRPVESDAVRDLLSRAMASEEPLYVAAIGACTNIASALLLEPRLKDRLVVVWLGGQPPYFGHGYEFNMGQDIRAAQTLFDSGVPLVWVPCMGVASLLSFSDDEARNKLNGKSRIGTYLTDIIFSQFTGMEKALSRAKTQRTLQLRGQEDRDEAYFAQFPSRHVAWSRTIWDIAAIAWLKNPGWCASALTPAPVLRGDCTYGPQDKRRHSIRLVRYCQRDLIFGDLVACLDHDEPSDR